MRIRASMQRHPLCFYPRTIREGIALRSKSRSSNQIPHTPKPRFANQRTHNTLYHYWQPMGRRELASVLLYHRQSGGSRCRRFIDRAYPCAGSYTQRLYHHAIKTTALTNPIPPPPRAPSGAFSFPHNPVTPNRVRLYSNTNTPPALRANNPLARLQCAIFNKKSRHRVSMEAAGPFLAPIQLSAFLGQFNCPVFPDGSISSADPPIGADRNPLRIVTGCLSSPPPFVEPPLQPSMCGWVNGLSICIQEAAFAGDRARATGWASCAFVLHPSPLPQKPQKLTL